MALALLLCFRAAAVPCWPCSGGPWQPACVPAARQPTINQYKYRMGGRPSRQTEPETRQSTGSNYCTGTGRVPPDVDQIYTISQSADLGFGPTNLRTSEIFKRPPPVLHVFFSSACRILLDLWTFSPVRARYAF